MVVARLENQHRWEEAYALLQEGLAQKQHIAALFQQELTLEMVFVCLVTGRIEEARQLYTDRLRKYVKQFMKTHSSKQRIHFATTLLLDGNREEALAARRQPRRGPQAAGRPEGTSRRLPLTGRGRDGY